MIAPELEIPFFVAGPIVCLFDEWSFLPRAEGSAASVFEYQAVGGMHTHSLLFQPDTTGSEDDDEELEMSWPLPDAWDTTTVAAAC